ncbi:MAG TPA: aspartate aminotransferase family protein [Thermoanaerobaculia bacterium]|nr:aspartate aminotransferase family protein [Thermoanaerobaculia bacterium]
MPSAGPTRSRGGGLGRGDLLPEILAPPPGPRSRALSSKLAATEAPGVNTLFGGEPALVWEQARGANVLDVDGNRYLDLTSGFGAAAVGHRHPGVVAAVRRQSRLLLHGLGDVAAHPARVELAQRLVRLAPVDDARVYFATSGAEAVEIALKTALLATGRSELLAFDPAYHGLTFGALAVTSRPEFREPFRDRLGTVHRPAFGAPLSEIEPLLATTRVAAAIVEPVVGREGILLPPPGWLAGLAALCRRHGTLLVADEIWTGFGRTGAWFASVEEGVRPDLLCCGKALGGGLPIAATLGAARWMAAWGSPGEARHTSTFLGHPLACAAALAALEILEREDLPGRASRMGRALSRRFAGWPARFAGLLEVRGRGLLWGLELEGGAAAARLVSFARSRGVLVLAGGPDGKVVEIAPPLSIRSRQLDFALSVLEEGLSRSLPRMRTPG